MELSKLWTGYQNEMLLLSFLTNMADNLQQFLEIHSQLFPEEILTSLLEGVTVKSDEERIKETMGMESWNFLVFPNFPRFYSLNFLYNRCFTEIAYIEFLILRIYTVN